MTARIYLSPEEPFHIPEFQLNGVGVHEVMDPGLYRRPHGPDCWILMHFHNPAQCLIQGQLREVAPGTTVLWEPGVPHSFGHPTRPWDHSWLMIGGTFMEELVAQSTIPANRILQDCASSIILHELDALMDELLDHVPPDRRILQAHVTLLLRRLHRALQDDAPGSLPPALRGIPRFLEQNLHRALTLTEIARHAGLSPSRFSEIFTQHLGISPMRYLEKRRMHHAARLLRDRGLRVGEVALELGYRDPLYFSRRFRNHFGQSPNSYRRTSSRTPPSNDASQRTIS